MILTFVSAVTLGYKLPRSTSIRTFQAAIPDPVPQTTRRCSQPPIHHKTLHSAIWLTTSSVLWNSRSHFNTLLLLWLPPSPSPSHLSFPNPLYTMPKDNYGKSYSYKSSGSNSRGSHYCSRDYGSSASNQNAYHYSNADGSYYYANPDGSKYYNPGSSGVGKVTYTPPAGGSSSQGNSSSGQSSGSVKGSSGQTSGSEKTKWVFPLLTSIWSGLVDSIVVRSTAELACVREFLLWFSIWMVVVTNVGCISLWLCSSLGLFIAEGAP